MKGKVKGIPGIVYEILIALSPNLLYRPSMARIARVIAPGLPLTPGWDLEKR